MADKILNTRISLKYGAIGEWSSTFKPLKGEVCFSEVTTEKKGAAGNIISVPAVVFKVGDGVKTFGELPWASALAADVYEWAKKPTLDVNDLPTLPIEVIDNGIGKFVTDITYANDQLIITRSDIAWNDIQDKPDLGVMSVEGKEAIAVTGDADVEVNLKLDNSGNVALSQSDVGLKAAIDLSEYRKIADDENTITTISAGNHIGEITDNGTNGNHAYVINGKDWSGVIAGALAEAKEYADNNDANDNTEYHVEYDSLNKKIKLVAGADASKMEIPTDDFVKDGMIQSVVISEDGKNLTITWNTDAGLDATNIPLSELVDIITGVDGTTIAVNVSADDKISAEIKTGVITDGHIATNAAIAKGKLSPEVQASLGKADSALQAQDIIGKADKVSGATAGNFAGLDANGNLTDSGVKAADFAPYNIDTGVHSVTLESGTNNGTVKLTVDGAATDNIAVTGLGALAYEDSVDTGVMSVGVAAGFKNTGTATDPVIDVIQKGEEGAVTWIFDCGGAE